MQKLTTLLVVLLIFITIPVSADFELSGKLERGSNTYFSNQDLSEDEIIDFYNYDNLWVKLKKKLDYPNYYYMKLKYYEKLYEDESAYDNRSLDLSGNYTQEFKEKFRNKFKIKLRDKQYINNIDSSYFSYSLAYQFRHEVNETNQYSLDFQTKEYLYSNNQSKDYQVNTYQVNWKRDLSEKFEIEFGYQLKNKNHYYNTDSSDKVGQRFSIDFSYEL